MATGANTTPLGPLHPILAARIGQPSPGAGAGVGLGIIPGMGGLLPTPPQFESVTPPTSASLSSATNVQPTSLGSKDPELKKHLEAAKRAASALFPGQLLRVQEREGGKEGKERLRRIEGGREGGREKRFFKCPYCFISKLMIIQHAGLVSLLFLSFSLPPSLPLPLLPSFPPPPSLSR